MDLKMVLMFLSYLLILLFYFLLNLPNLIHFVNYYHPLALNYLIRKEFTLKLPTLSKVIAPFVNVPSIVILCIPVTSLLLSTDTMSLGPTVPDIVPCSKLISSGVAVIVVVDGIENGMYVTQLSAK